MRSISTVHRPTPRASVSRVTISSSASRATTRREGTTPAAAFSAMSLMRRTLGRAQPPPPQGPGAHGEPLLGAGKPVPAEEGDEAGKDGGGGAAVQLLVHHGPHQRLKGRPSALDPYGAGPDPA